jgi:prophage regulatory protein
MQVLRLPALEDKVGLKHSAIYKMVAAHQFPRPIVLGPRAVGWLEHEVDEWLRHRAEARPAVAA